MNPKLGSLVQVPLGSRVRGEDPGGGSRKRAALTRSRLALFLSGGILCCVWVGAAIGILSLASERVFAQAGAGPGLFWQCVAPSSANPNGGYCPVGQIYPLPMGATASHAETITPSDSTVYTPALRAIYNGTATACDIAVVAPGDTSAVTFANVIAGSVLPVGAKQVMSTGTDCTSVVGIR